MFRKDLLSLTLPLALAACGSSSNAGVLPAAAPASTKLILDSLQRLSNAWNAGDGDAWAAEYWPDGSLVNILGAVFANSVAVAGVTNAILAGPFKGSTFASVVRRSRTIGSDAAIVDTDVSVTHFRGLPPGAIATQPGLLLTRFTHVFENRDGVWKITASQNTAVLPAST